VSLVSQSDIIALGSRVPQVNSKMRARERQSGKSVHLALRLSP